MDTEERKVAERQTDMEQQLTVLVAQVQVLESLVDALWSLALVADRDSAAALAAIEKTLKQEYPDPGEIDLDEKENCHYKLAHVIAGVRLREIKKRLSGA